MPVTGVFFIPSNPNSSTALSTITERLHTYLSDEPIPIGRWALEHKLMRDTPSCLPASASQRPAQPRWMQFLSLSYYPVHGFVYASASEQTQAQTQAQSQGQQQQQQNASVQQPQPQQKQQDAPAQQQQPQTTPHQAPMIMTTIPLPSTLTLFHHFVYACQPFWCHRHTHAVMGGLVYDIGDFRVRLGDVRQTQPVARVRGTVVEIEWRGPSCVSMIDSAQAAAAFMGNDVAGEGDTDSGIDMVTTSIDAIEEADVDAEFAATGSLIREFWGKLGVDGAREAILVPDVGKEMKERLRKLKQQQVDSNKQSARDKQEGVAQDEDPDPDAGVDVARQFMEIFRFSR